MWDRFGNVLSSGTGVFFQRTPLIAVIFEMDIFKDDTHLHLECKNTIFTSFNTMVFKIDLNAMWPYLYATVYGAATAKNRCQEVVLQIFLRNIGEMNREL